MAGNEMVAERTTTSGARSEHLLGQRATLSSSWRGWASGC